MSGLQVFINAEFGNVRSFMVGGEPFFIAKDIAEIKSWVMQIRRK